jgi:predicted nucleic acid-binding Zn ribbon protein
MSAASGGQPVDNQVWPVWADPVDNEPTWVAEPDEPDTGAMSDPDAPAVEGTDELDVDEFDEREPSDGDADGDLARSVLEGARTLSRRVPRRRDRDARRRTRDENLAGRTDRNRGGYSGARPDPARDPHRLGSLLPGAMAELGWERPMADARVFAQWPALVGADIAAHCAPQSLRDGQLRITAESTAWATQLRLLAGRLLARLVAELGSDVVRSVVITGPTGPSWKHGMWSVRGARGPRDTYG